jgi:hypothetical protein
VENAEVGGKNTQRNFQSIEGGVSARGDDAEDGSLHRYERTESLITGVTPDNTGIVSYGQTNGIIKFFQQKGG